MSRLLAWRPLYSSMRACWYAAAECRRGQGRGEAGQCRLLLTFAAPPTPLLPSCAPLHTALPLGARPGKLGRRRGVGRWCVPGADGAAAGGAGLCDGGRVAHAGRRSDVVREPAGDRLLVALPPVSWGGRGVAVPGWEGHARATGEGDVGQRARMILGRAASMCDGQGMAANAGVRRTRTSTFVCAPGGGWGGGPHACAAGPLPLATAWHVTSRLDGGRRQCSIWLDGLSRMPASWHHGQGRIHPTHCVGCNMLTQTGLALCPCIIIHPNQSWVINDGLDLICLCGRGAQTLRSIVRHAVGATHPAKLPTSLQSPPLRLTFHPRPPLHTHQHCLPPAGGLRRSTAKVKPA